MRRILLLLFFGISVGIFAQSNQVIQSVNPNSGLLGQTLQVTITGDNTNFSQVSDSYNVSFYNQLQQQLVVNAINAISDTEMTVDLTIPPTVLPGLYSLYVYTAGAVVSLANAFNVTTTYNSIIGNIRYDANGDGCDSSDPPAAATAVVLTTQTEDVVTFTDSIGNYIFYIPAGDYVVAPQIDPALFASSPASAPISFATEESLSATQDFCLSANGVHNDLVISILPLTPARPGFNAMYRIAYENAGNQVLSGTVNFTFDDSRLDFISATPAASSQSLNNLNWDYANLLPFEQRSIDVTLNVNTPQETPAVNIGDILPYTATINPISGDDTPAHNTANFDHLVVGSYDPNDKAVTEGSQIDISAIGDDLHYLIRFQNTGTYAAQDVRVKDMLASNLDPSTVEIVSASHPYRSTLTAGNQLEFFFDNINLPPVTTDEPGSHGFVAFKIKPSNTVGVGSAIENTADIYFDFNFPIVTNTVTTTVALLANKNFDFADGIQLYPNPAGDILNINFQTAVVTANVKIFNQLGQLVKSLNDIGQNQSNTVSVADLKSGTYIVQITTDKGTSVKKLLKY